MKQETENNYLPNVKRDLIKSGCLSLVAIGIVILINFLRR